MRGFASRAIHPRPERRGFPRSWIKFSKERSYLTDFVEKGHIYINTAKYFTQCESEASGQDDMFEMATSYHQHEGASIELNGRIFKISRPFILREGEPAYSHIFCLYSLSVESISRSEEGQVFDSRLWDEFGSYFVLIHDANSFMKKLDFKLKEQGYRYKSDYIEYFDPNAYEGEVGAFRKRNIYSHQEEYRIAVDQPNISEPIECLYLGSLEDIAYGPVHKDQSKNTIENGKIVL